MCELNIRVLEAQQIPIRCAASFSSSPRASAKRGPRITEIALLPTNSWLMLLFWPSPHLLMHLLLHMLRRHWRVRLPRLQCRSGALLLPTGVRRDLP